MIKLPVTVGGWPQLRARVVTASPWALPMLLMAGLGVWRLSRPALWADELATANVGALPWSSFWELVSHTDFVHAPYYIFAHAWMSVSGASEWALRLPSVVAMAGAVGLTAWLGVRLRDPATGLLAGLILTVLPSASRYAQEARPYAATLFFAALATLLLDRALQQPSGGRLTAYGVTLALLTLAHPMAILLVAAHAVPAWISGHRVKWLAAALPAVLPATILMAASFGQSGDRAWIVRLTWARAVDSPARLAGAAAVGGALLVLGLLAINRERSTVLIASWALVPSSLLLAAGFVAPVWVFRFVLFTLPAWALLAAFTLRRVGWQGAALIVAVIALLGASVQLSQRRGDGHGQASRSIATTVGAGFRPGDVAVYADDHPSIPWAPRDIVARYLPAQRTPRDALALTAQRSGGHLLATECSDIEACLAGARRVWVIRCDNPADPLAGANAKFDYLRAHYRVEQVWRLPLLTIALATGPN